MKRTTHVNGFGLAAALAVAALALCAAVPASAGMNKLFGYYECETDMMLIDNRWQFGPPANEGMPRQYLELKYLSYPYQNLESFFKLRVETNRDDTSTPRVDYKYPFFLAAEGHMKFNGPKWESFVFYRQNRGWLYDEPLLALVNADKIKNDNWGPQSSGVRTDFWKTDLWKLKGLGGTFIYFDDGGTFNWTSDPDQAVADGTDNFIMRLRKNSFGDRLNVGTTLLRKDWTNTGVSRSWLAESYNNVYAADVSFYPRNLVSSGLSFGPLNLENTSWIAEYAASNDPFQIETSDLRSNENRFAFTAEVRNIRVWNVIVHAWYNNFGENFRDYLSWRFDDNREFNRRQYHVESIILFPLKAITGTVTYDFYKKRIVDEEGGELRPTSNLYTELYVEFIKGFKGKVSYNRWHGFDGAAEVFDFYTYPNIFAELSVENSLAKVRIQGRIRDWRTFRQIYAYGYDMEFNATGKLKGYFRLLNVNEETEARATVYARVSYDVGYKAELFAEYGNGYDSDNLVNTDGFVNEGSSSRIANQVKLFLKLNLD
jgi:hypothetical protein